MRSAAKLVVLVGILGGLLGCREEAAPVADNSEAPARLVLSMEVHPVTRDGALFTGVVAARTESELGFRVAGEVIERRVDPGDRVKRGDVLLVLDVDDFELALRARCAVQRSARQGWCRVGTVSDSRNSGLDGTDSAGGHRVH